MCLSCQVASKQTWVKLLAMIFCSVCPMHAADNWILENSNVSLWPMLLVQVKTAPVEINRMIVCKNNDITKHTVAQTSKDLYAYIYSYKYVYIRIPVLRNSKFSDCLVYFWWTRYFVYLFSNHNDKTNAFKSKQIAQPMCTEKWSNIFDENLQNISRLHVSRVTRKNDFQYFYESPNKIYTRENKIRILSNVFFFYL